MWIGGSKFYFLFLKKFKGIKIMLYFRYVDTHPAWGKRLEADLTVGVTVVTFRARSHNSNLNEICRVVITVKGMLIK